MPGCTNWADKNSNIITVITIIIIITILQHIEKPGIVRTVYSGIFRHILEYSAILHHSQIYWVVWSHIQTFETLSNPFIYNHTIFKTLAYLEPGASSKACWTCNRSCIFRTESWHCQNSLFKHFQGYLGMFRDIDAYSATHMAMLLGV